jgi:hypothetical protein
MHVVSPSSKPIPTGNKKRFIYLAAALLAILSGLCARAYGPALSPFLSAHAGDALWAMMVYFFLRFLLVRKSLGFAASLSLLFCFGIEFSQLYQAQWINQIRGTSVGALVLGHGFLFIDLLRYAAGIGIAAALDKTASLILNAARFSGKKKQ